MAVQRNVEYSFLQRHGGVKSAEDVRDHDRVFKTAPIITGDAFLASSEDMFPQRAVYGQIISQRCPNFPSDVESEILYINTNAPFSAVVCGVQGSGKSHSTSVLLESCLILDPRLGTLPEPLSAIVFHYDAAAGSGAVQACEAAYVGTLDPERGGHATPPRVTVLVLPGTLNNMKKVYGRLGSHIRIEPLRFAPEDISGERLLSMMKVDTDSHMPLYMVSIMDILRSMEDCFDYKHFRDELKARSKDFNPTQKSMLNLRLALLDSCLEGGNRSNRATSFFRRGHLVIIDLSSAFMDSSTACGLFEITLGLFIEARTDATGKLVILDEAHKYLTNNATTSSWNAGSDLHTRTYGRTRFSSPTWLKHLEQHVSTVDLDWLEKVITLQTGEALIFAPSGVGLSISDSSTGESDDEFLAKSGKSRCSSRTALASLGRGYLHVQSRLRVTLDGGMSIMSTDETLRQFVEREEPGWPPSPATSTSGSQVGEPLPAGLHDGLVDPKNNLAMSATFSTLAYTKSSSRDPTAPPLSCIPGLPVSDTPRPAWTAPSLTGASSMSTPGQGNTTLATRTSAASPVPFNHRGDPSVLSASIASVAFNAGTPIKVTFMASSSVQLTTEESQHIEELRRALVRLNAEGNCRPSYNDIGMLRGGLSWKYTGKISNLARKAAKANIVDLLEGGYLKLKSSLSPPTTSTEPSLASSSYPLALVSPPPPATGFSHAAPLDDRLDPAIRELKRGLIKLYRNGNHTPSFTHIDIFRGQNSWSYRGDIGVLVHKAAQEKVVTVVNGNSASLRIPSNYQALVGVMCAEYARTWELTVAFEALPKLLTGPYSGSLEQYVEGAILNGFIRMRGGGSSRTVELAI